MININNKIWVDVTIEDIKSFLMSSEIENCFFEFKEDEISPGSLVKEISAFANTYGGYIFLGISDNKDIVGCHKWDEQRIHTTIHDSITPVPKFQVKCFVDDVPIYVIRIEEGVMPPYITNKGQIFERISSGSFLVNESSKLIQLYHKAEVSRQQLKNKIELPLISTNGNFPDNFCGYIDLGFSVTLSSTTEVQKNFYNIDLQSVRENLRGICSEVTISQGGFSYIFNIGKISVKNHNGKQILVPAGMSTFIEIMDDGSVKSRIILNADEGTKVNIAIFAIIYDTFRTIYLKLVGENFTDNFISAYKYERLTVTKQFEPYLKLSEADIEKNKSIAKEYVEAHRRNYGNNLIVVGNRIPVNGYDIIDGQTINQFWGDYNIENLIYELFHSNYFNLGFIDQLDFIIESNVDEL